MLMLVTQVARLAPVQRGAVGADLEIRNVTDTFCQWRDAFDRTTAYSSETEL